jgi:hypothetical protein
LCDHRTPVDATEERQIWSVPLPEGAEPPYQVFVNGEARTEGEDYAVEGRWLRFQTRLVPQARLGAGRRLMLLMGIGVYGDLKGDVVDLQYHAGGERRLASNLPIIAPQAPGPAGSG